MQVDVKAYDLGDPQLSSVVSVPIFIRHVATVPPEVGIGFADDSYTVQIPENSPANTLVKSFTIVNSRVLNNGIPLRCTIVSGNPESKIRVELSLSFTAYFELNFHICLGRIEERPCAWKFLFSKKQMNKKKGLFYS